MVCVQSLTVKVRHIAIDGSLMLEFTFSLVACLSFSNLDTASQQPRTPRHERYRVLRAVDLVMSWLRMHTTTIMRPSRQPTHSFNTAPQGKMTLPPGMDLPEPKLLHAVYHSMLR